MDSETATGRQMHIGEVAARTGLSLRTIRHYDEIGLLPPSGRTDGGFRLYSDDDVERLLLVRTLKPLGFSLETTGELLGLLGDLDSAAAAESKGPIRARLEEFIAEAVQRRQALARQLELADELIAILRSR